nr:NADH dehydrogenase subunit 3 [Rhabdopleura sp. NHMO H2136]
MVLWFYGFMGSLKLMKLSLFFVFFYLFGGVWFKVSVILFIFGFLFFGFSWVIKKFSFSGFSPSLASPYECGFEPFNSSRVPFSLKFFYLALLFVLFDAELMFLFPLVFNCGCKYGCLVGWWICLFLWVMFVAEWYSGGIVWAD